MFQKACPKRENQVHFQKDTAEFDELLSHCLTHPVRRAIEAYIQRCTLILVMFTFAENISSANCFTLTASSLLATMFPLRARATLS